MPTANEAHSLDRCMTCHEAAEFLGTTVKTLEAWRVRKRGPWYLKQGRSVRYRLRDLLSFQERNVVNTGDAA